MKLGVTVKGAEVPARPVRVPAAEVEGRRSYGRNSIAEFGPHQGGHQGLASC